MVMKGLVPKGARLRLTRDLSTHGLSTWRAPFTGSFETTIPAGTILVADNGQREGAPGLAWCPRIMSTSNLVSFRT